MGQIHERIREFWDRDAETYDRSPAHALNDPVEAAAWRAVLRRSLPDPGSRILEAGAGTGSITLLLAELGYRVTGLDLSEGMLARARRKLEGFDEVELVTGPADRPPPGPFDAVVERNMLWTNPEPVATLVAWRRVVRPGGRLLLLEGLHDRGGIHVLRERAADLVRRAIGVPHEHHDHYDPEVRAALPLAGMGTPAPLVEAVARAGWSAVRLERLRDVEWARRTAPPRLLGLLETPPLFAVTADA
jgi:SAM-dependent methyltransferase